LAGGAGACLVSADWFLLSCGSASITFNLTHKINLSEKLPFLKKHFIPFQENFVLNLKFLKNGSSDIILLSSVVDSQLFVIGSGVLDTGTDPDPT
jgi:hypothetical protein